MIRSRLGPTSFAIALTMTLLAGQAVAQDQAAIEKLVQMNKKALDDYDTLEWDSAKKTLLDALVAGKKAGLDNHPVMARTYVHLGAVYITGFKNRDKAMQSFNRALEIDPAIQLSKGIATSDVSEAFAAAKRERGIGGGGEAAPPPGKKRKGPVMEGSEEAAAAPKKRPPREEKSSTSDDDSEEKDLPVKIQALDCPNEDEAIIDKPATLRCAVAPNLPVAKVFLLYQEPGKEEYSELEMKKSPKGWWVGKVPKKAVTGKSVKYYFEGRNAAGKAVVRNGELESPNFLLVMEEDAYREAKKKRTTENLGEDVENPLDVAEGPVRQSRLGAHREDVGLDVRFGKRKWWIGLGGGSGFGYAKGNGLEAVNNSPETTVPAGTPPACGQGSGFHDLSACFQPGGAWAGFFHLAPEVGFMLTPNLALSVEGRLQYIPQDQKFQRFAARGAISGLLKLMRYTKQSQVRFFGTALAGGGEGFRFVVKPGSSITDPNDPLYKVRDFTDTVKAGPVIAGLGGGVYFEASKRASIVAEVHALAGFPTFGVVLDGNVALQINFYSETESAAPGRYVPKEEDEEPK
jgi:hypothetical protein